jgi:hypothetical protein
MAKRPPPRVTRSQQRAAQAARKRRSAPTVIATPDGIPGTVLGVPAGMDQPMQPPPQPVSVLVAPMPPAPRPQPMPYPEAADHTAQDIAEVRRNQVAAITPPAAQDSEPGQTHAIDLTQRRTVGVEPTRSVEFRVDSRDPLSERPAEIREAARALSQAIKDQIEQLNASKPNEPEDLARQNDFVAFLQEIATGLDALAESIDRAIAVGSAASPEPILLGKSGEIARKLSAVVTEGLERNRTYIMDCTIKFGVFAAGFTLLRACGVDGYIAGIVAAIMNVKLSKGSARPEGRPR